MMEVCRVVRPDSAFARRSLARPLPKGRNGESGLAFHLRKWPGPVRGGPLRVVLRADRRRLHARYRNRSNLLQLPLQPAALTGVRACIAASGVGGVMKCAHPGCNRGIGLLSYRRPFTKARYCSKQCRDSCASEAEKPVTDHHPATYFEWLFLQPPSADPLPQLARPASRIRNR